MIQAYNGEVPLQPGVNLLVVATVARTIAGFLIPYATHFRTLGWRVDAAANGATRDPRLREAFDRVYELPLSRSVRDVRGMKHGQRALQDILEGGPDIVHVHTPIAGFLTRLAVRQLPLAKRPSIAYTAHGFHFHEGGHPATNAAFLAAERIAGRWTDRLVVMNDEDEAAALHHRIVPRRRLVRMPGIGLDTGAYSPAIGDPDEGGIRAKLGIATSVPIFAVVGELSGRKRQRDAIAALAAMKYRDAHLVLAGDGRERSRLEAQACGLGARERVHFLGNVIDVRPVVRAAIAVILPSDREGLARSVMESLSLGVPVIASTARGNQELIGTNSGIVYPIGDVSALANAMDHVTENPQAAAAMGVNGRRRMVEQYDLPILLQLHETLYSQMLAEHPRPSG